MNSWETIHQDRVGNKVDILYEGRGEKAFYKLCDFWLINASNDLDFLIKKK